MKKILITLTAVIFISICTFCIGLQIGQGGVTEEKAIEAADINLERVIDNDFIDSSYVEVREVYQVYRWQEDVLDSETIVYIDKVNGKILDVVEGG